MRETFPKKHKGSKLPHQEWNTLTDVARRTAGSVPGSNQSGIAGGPFSSQAPLPVAVATPVEISNLQINSSDSPFSGLYLCKIRYYDFGDDKEWKSNPKEWELDANAMDSLFGVGDFLLATWHQQRGMFVPATESLGDDSVRPLVDARGSNSSFVSEETGETGSEVEFWLEIVGDSVVAQRILDRSFFINAYHEDSDVTVSGVGFVTWLATDDEEVRLALLASEALGDVTLEYGAIRLEAIAPEGIEATHGAAPDASYVESLVFEAEVNNADGVLRWPKFTITGDDDDRIKIELPGSGSWTIKAEFTVTITAALGSGSSISSSSISTSSISTSSESTSESSISTSSESLSSESTTPG